jgi:hypothetical protein
VENYFNYFTEIEEHFQQRRGGPLILSTLDWSLIDLWKEAGIPLEAVLHGIDSAFDRYDQRPSKTRKVNSLAYCSQEVLAAAEEMKEATVGVSPSKENRDRTGFQVSEVVAFLRQNSEQLLAAKLPERNGLSGVIIAKQAGENLCDLAAELESKNTPPRFEDLERKLTVLEEKLFAVLLAATADDELVQIRAEADREVRAYRQKMPASQIEQLHKRYIQKRLLENYKLPRLSLFYM